MTQDAIIYLIDPQQSDRQATQKQLEGTNLRFESYASPEPFLSVVNGERVGCVLTELQLGNVTVFQVVKRLRQQNSVLPVILLTAHATVPVAVQAFKGGLFDVLEKPCEQFQLWECMTRAFENHDEAMRQVDNRNDIKNRISHLSHQELHVMQKLLDGEPNKVIAAKLGISPRTVVFRRKSVMQKMHAKSIAELACMIQLVSAQHSRTAAAEVSAILDVITTANLCGIANGQRSNEFGAVNDGDNATRLHRTR